MSVPFIPSPKRTKNYRRPKYIYILFIHAWTGADTTSAIHNFGKVKMLKKFENPGDEWKKLADIFMSDEARPDEIRRAGCSLMALWYGNSSDQSLTTLRFYAYEKAIAEKSSIQPKCLPPTERAAHFHSLRVHLQTVRWLKLDDGYLV